MHLNKMALCVSNLQGGYLMLFSHKQKSCELLEIPERILAGMTTLSFSWLPELGICNLQNKFKIKYPAGPAGTVELTDYFAIQSFLSPPFLLSLALNELLNCSLGLFVFTSAR